MILLTKLKEDHLWEGYKYNHETNQKFSEVFPNKIVLAVDNIYSGIPDILDYWTKSTDRLEGLNVQVVLDNLRIETKDGTNGIVYAFVHYDPFSKYMFYEKR